MVHYTILAQTPQFNKLYNTDSTRELSPCVLPTTDEGYIVGGISRYNSSSLVYVRKINKWGEQKWQTNIVSSDTAQVSTYFGGNLVKTLDNNYLISGSMEYTNQTQRDIFLCKFTQSGDTIWHKFYHAVDTLYATNAIVVANDNGYLIIGTAWHQLNNAQSFLLLKTDSLGNLQWRKIYNSDFGRPFHAEQTTDGGYIVSGYNYHAATGYDMYAIKTDSLGNVQWEHTYGTDEDDGGCLVLEVAAGQYALLGLISKVEEFQPFWYTEIQLLFARLDSMGNIITGTKRYFANQSVYSCQSAYFDKQKNEIVAVTLSYTPNPTKPYLTKFSLSGDMLLNAPLSTGIGTEDYLRDVEPTPDGGFVLAGFNFTNPSRGWVVKTDSLGNTCGEADCDNYVEPIGIDIVGSFQQSMQVYPNPATNQLHITSTIPATFVLYDLLGRAVRQVGLDSGTAQISVLGLPAGTYFYQIINPQKQILQHDKLIVLH